MRSIVCKMLFPLLLLWQLPALAATVLVFGDSLSAGYGLAPGQGWAALLARDLAPRHKVVNASVSGETSAGGLARLPDALARHRPDVLVLELGANDGLRGLPMAEMRRNLQRMIDLAQARKAKVLLVGMALPPNYGPRYGAEFRGVYDDLARRNRLAYVPLLVEGFAGDLSAFQPDGLHPRAEKQATMMRTVKAKLPVK
ncbi:arylesterase [Pseudogulbenkiania ferrooxidans]|uniref:GDSL family lipase n=1 Tax=Pseudogulbenkiania ferrooxidans EGD-HP2 TaxID=1388764 RepID=A0ABN0N1Z0_9NEIS|nr:arylesterase [Pseudogulbenkiania ferrooxidans]ERD99997.1 GDSL family lipase [Pseudogulbenkiania ferrooxidans EGD-HP2]